jgi:ribosomal-protein-alanine N-acetyltransferase
VQTTDITLETDRLILRPPRMTDVDAIVEQVNNPKIARNTLSIPHPYNHEMALEFLENVTGDNWHKDEGHRPFILIRKTDETLIGICGMGVPGRAGRTEIGYWIGEAYWGNGYATEAARAVVRYGFEVLNAHRIQATYFTWNPASRRVMEKIGMQYEGILRGYVVKDGEAIDVGMCAITRPDWDS